MNSFAHESAARLPAGMELPDELVLLLDWIQEQGWLVQEPETVGIIQPPERQGELGSEVVFRVMEPEERAGFVQSWLGVAGEAVVPRLAPIARTGADGSHAALWLDDAGRQHVVHLGSGSGSSWVGVIGGVRELLLLLSIGYEEICWNEQFDAAPEEWDASESHEPENEAYRAWVVETLGCELPEIGHEIVEETPEMGDTESDDPFWNWVREVQSSSAST